MNRKRHLAGRKHCKIVQVASAAVQWLDAEALQHHQAGRLSEAERLYRQVLAINPRHADTLHRFGVVAFQTGRYHLAVNMISKAITINAKIASYHCNLGIALWKQGRGNKAAACYRDALNLDPALPEAYTNLGTILEEEGRPEEAIACHRRALDLKPDLPEALSNLGNLLQKQGGLDEAGKCHCSALSLKPDSPEAYYNLANVLMEQGRLDEATSHYRSALDLKPNFPAAHCNLGNVLVEQGRLDEAIACYRMALSLEPDLPDGHINLALALLLRGDMAEGWKEHEWRWKSRHRIKGRRDFAQPQWHGEAAAGRTLLIHAEQGFGDTLQFCRYATLAAARGLRVVLEVQKPLVELLRSLSGADSVMEIGGQLPPFDFHCPMLSMPLALGTTLATIPSAESYLHAEEAQVATWRIRLAAIANPGLRIGLVWAGNPHNHAPALAATDRRRSMAPDRLAPLFNVPGLNFFSLQKDGPTAPKDFPLTDYMNEMADFADTAAFIANLDLVISVDTAVAHLGSALGKPVWILDRFDHCWRWLTDRRDSPWYPKLRLYRQPHPGDWDSVLAEVARDLRTLAATP
jgi:tetratricopeptide (TPR) repeat protein